MEQAAVVTGVSSGLGESIAQRLLECGYRVYGTVRNAADLDRFEATGDGAKGHLLDVRDADAVADFGSLVTSDLERLDCELTVLINNAGILAGGGVSKTPVDTFVEAMDVNFLGPIRLIQAFAPLLRSADNAAIVNVSSLAASAVVSPQAPYAAAKSALETASEALAQELDRDGVRVITVVLGVVDTPIHRKPVLGLDLGDEDILVAGLRLAAYVRSCLKSPMRPTAVGAADAIVSLLQDPDAPTKVEIGEDTQGVLALRRQLGPEGWAALWTLRTTPAEWAAEIGRAIGRTLPDPAV